MGKMGRITEKARGLLKKTGEPKNKKEFDESVRKADEEKSFTMIQFSKLLRESLPELSGEEHNQTLKNFGFTLIELPVF